MFSRILIVIMLIFCNSLLLAENEDSETTEVSSPALLRFLEPSPLPEGTHDAPKNFERVYKLLTVAAGAGATFWALKATGHYIPNLSPNALVEAWPMLRTPMMIASGSSFVSIPFWTMLTGVDLEHGYNKSVFRKLFHDTTEKVKAAIKPEAAEAYESISNLLTECNSLLKWLQ